MRLCEEATMILLGEEGKFMTELPLYTNTPVTLFCANETDGCVDLVRLKSGFKYATIPPRTTFKAKEYFQDCLLILESVTRQHLNAQVRYVGGYSPRSRRACHHVFVSIGRKIPSLREISMARISRAGWDFEKLMLPETLKVELSQMVERRQTFLDHINCICVHRNYNPKIFHVELPLTIVPESSA